ncbi:MAG: helix-turn-helix transcriptional regulator [Bdellovibrionales bacterium]|nr:helix-turn-helix transcriptional regulator [Bdellovibrionales bacterium]
MTVNQKVSLTLLKVLKNIRLQEGLSQSELANLLGVPQSFVSKYEGNERRLSFDEVWTIIQVLNFPPEKFTKIIIKELKDKNEVQ